MPEFIDPFKGMIPDRKMTDREVLRAIRQCLSAEEEAVHLYESIADATDNQLVKEAMQDIANEEKVHKGEFQELLNRLDIDESSFMEDGIEEVNNMSEELVLASKLVKLAKQITSRRHAVKEKESKLGVQLYIDVNGVIFRTISLDPNISSFKKKEFADMLNLVLSRYETYHDDFNRDIKRGDVKEVSQNEYIVYRA